MDDEHAHVSAAGARGDVVWRSAAHDRQRAVLRLRRRPGHGRVEQRMPRSASARRSRASRRRDRRHVDASVPGAAPCAAPRAEQHLARPARRRRPSDHDVGAGGGLGGRRRRRSRRARRPMPSAFAGRGPHRQLVSGARRGGGHARAHDPEAEEADAAGGSAGRVRMSSARMLRGATAGRRDGIAREQAAHDPPRALAIADADRRGRTDGVGLCHPDRDLRAAAQLRAAGPAW